MAAKSPLTDFEFPQLAETEIVRRFQLASEPEPEPARRPKLRRMLKELEFFLEPVRRPFRRIDIPKSDHPQIVLVLPGLGANPARMRYMARQIERAGHKTKRWGQGLNLGPSEDSLARLEDRLAECCDRYDSKVVLLGWSLGGLFARELAKRKPDSIAKVITMGTPFSGSMRANNAWRVYQFVAGHRVDKPPIEAVIDAKPPVDTVALWSPNDGVISPRSAAGFPGERDRAVALRCTHMGFSYSPEAIHAVLRELDVD